jgi:hypothetical protein
MRILVALTTAALLSLTTAAARQPERPSQAGQRRADSRFTIVAGCDLPDCFPAGSTPQTVDWRVTVTGPAGAAVAVEFQASVNPEAAIGVSGPATWLSSSVLCLDRGVTNLLHVPVLASASLAPMVLVSNVNRSESQNVSLQVDQLVLGTVVSSQVVDWKRPQDPPGQGDELRVEGGGDDPQLLLLDAAVEIRPELPGRCLSDALFTVSPTAAMGLSNLSADPACRSEVVVFSRASSIAVEQPAWTPAADRQSIQLVPPIVVPVAIWTMRNPDVGTGVPVMDLARQELARANEIYGSMGAGIQFGGVATDTGLVKATSCGIAPTVLNGLQAGGYAQGALNVYYVENAPTCTAGGWTEQKLTKYRNTIVIFPTADLETLAHELGHALRLAVDDTTEEDGHLGATNIMSPIHVSVGAVRDYVTLGQVYRANIEDLSVVNRFHLRESRRSCYLDGRTTCPPVDLDCARPWRDSRAPSSVSAGQRPVASSGDLANDWLARWLGNEDGPEPAVPEALRGHAGLRDALVALLSRGPSPAALERHRRHLVSALSGPGDVSAFAAVYQERFILRTRMRAAVALANLRGNQARELLAAVLNSLPNGSRLGMVIANLLDSLHTPTP